jgi:AraC-like DNA-binding protein/ligand-binding sensor protein
VAENPAQRLTGKFWSMSPRLDMILPEAPRQGLGLTRGLRPDVLLPQRLIGPMIAPVPPSLLLGLVRLIEQETGCKLNYDDLTGVLLQQIPELALPKENRQHITTLCQWAKSSTKGEDRCILCKIASNRRALSCANGYMGRCYLGLTDLVQPLEVEGRVLGVFYLGSVRIQEHLAASEQAVRDYCRRAGREPDEALAAWRQVPCIREQDLVAKRAWLAWLAEWMRQVIREKSVHPERMRRDLRAHRTRRYLLVPVTITRAIEYVHHHLDEPLKALAVASEVGCSPSHFSRLFHLTIGTTFGAYVTEQRLARARSLLKLRNMRIGEVAAACGFSDQNHFNRAMKRSSGLTPREYRQVSS